MKLFHILKATIRTKVAPILRKIQVAFSPTYIKKRVIVKIRETFSNMLDVRPKDRNDYYAIAGWLVSKKLAYLLIFLSIVLCGYYIWMVKPEIGVTESPYGTYKYDSFALKWQTGKVCILGKSGYKAYIGDIENGIVSGTGTLYNPAGKVVYEGEFAANAYNGMGKRYHANTNLWYDGMFKDNLFHGTGELYSESGTILYKGEFANGCMEGVGELYNAAGNLIYTGNFQKDQIQYQELLGKETAEISKKYAGIRRVYQSEEESCVVLPEIHAAYTVKSGEDMLDEEWTAGSLYVIQDYIYLDGTRVEDMKDVIELLGTPAYEGNTRISVADAIVLNEASEKSDSGEVLFGKAGLEIDSVFEDVLVVEGYDKNYLVYLYMFEKDDIAYTFFCKEKEKGFSFYMMQI